MIYNKKYYLSKGDLNRIAESAVLAQLAAIMYENRKIGYTQFQNTMFECVAHVLNGKMLNESKTRKRYYTSSELNEQIWKRGCFLLKECLLNEAQATMSSYQKQMQDRLNGYGYGQKKQAKGFGAGLAKFFGFDPNAGWSFGNILNGVITLASLVAAPFTGGGSLALKTAATGLGRAALSNIGKSLVANTGKNLIANTGRNLIANTGKNFMANAGKNFMANTGKNFMANAGKTVAQQTTPSLMKGIWTSAGRQALANRARQNFATSAGRAAIAKSAAKGVGTNLAFIHGGNLLFGQPQQGMYPVGGGYYGAY